MFKNGKIFFIPNHVDPEETVQGLQGDPGELGVLVLELLKTHSEERVPVVQEECFLRYTKKTGHKREKRQPKLSKNYHFYYLNFRQKNKITVKLLFYARNGESVKL